MLAARFDFNKLRSNYETVAPWKRERAYSQLSALVRSTLLEDGHRFVALIAWSDSQVLLSCIEQHRCGPLLARAIQDFGIQDDARSAGLRAILARKPFLPRDETADLAQSAEIAALLKDAGIPAILLDDGPPQFLVEEKHLQAASAIAEGARIVATIDESHAVSTDTSYPAMLQFAVSTADGSQRLNPVGNALYRAVRMLSSGVVLYDVYLLAAQLRAMSERERAALRHVLSLEKREPTRLEGIVQYAASLGAVSWNGPIAPKAYAAWLRRCGDLPARLRARSHGVEAGFALRGGVKHGLRVLRAGAGAREALARVGSSFAGTVYALFLNNP